MLPELYSIIISCVGLIGLFFNFLLIYLIIRYTMKEMEVYSKILLQTCIVDIIGIVLFVIVQPVFVSDNGMGTVWEYGITHYLPNPWQFLSFILYAFMIRFTSVNVCSQFIFRYLTVVRSVNIRRRHYLAIIISVLLPIILLFTLSFLSNNPTPENEHLTNYELAQILEIDNYTMENYVVGMRTRPTNLSSISSKYATFLTIITYSIIIICGIRIQYFVRCEYIGPNLEIMRKVNKQISIVLWSQALLALLPFFSQIIVNLSILNNSIFSTKLLFTITPAFNALILILNPLVNIEALVQFLPYTYKVRFSSLGLDFFMYFSLDSIEL